MDKNKQQLMIFGVVSLIFIVMLVMSFSKSRRNAAVGPVKEPVKIQAFLTEPVGQRKTTAFQNWGRDPFALGGTTATVESSGDLVLTGIFWDEVKPYCIINGKVVKVGNEIAGFRVLEIKKDSVIVQDQDKISILRLGKQ